jgi:hypothetical protein
MCMGGVRTKCIFLMDGWMDGWMLLLFVNELIPINPKWSERASRNEILFLRNQKNSLVEDEMHALFGWMGLLWLLLLLLLLSG